MKIKGSNIAVKATHHIISSGKLIGVVVQSGEDVDNTIVKVGDYVWFDPNYGINISLNGINLIILLEDRVEGIIDIDLLLSDPRCGGKNIVPLGIKMENKE
jgi:co-chaperonin GroES (HSP10)